MSEMNAFEKTFAVLDCIAGIGNNKKIKELSALLDMNRTTVYRIVEQLQSIHMIIVNEDSKKITIGPKAYQIGNAYLRNNTLAEQIKIILCDIAKQYPLSVGYCISENSIQQGKVFNIFEVSSLNEGEMSHESGRYYPVNRGAYGKTIMAFHEPREEIPTILRNANLYATTKNSKIDVDELLKEYEEIRKTGFGYSMEDTLEGYFGVGSPVRNSDGKVVGSVAAACFAFGWDSKQQKLVEQIILEGANKITSLLSQRVTLQ